MDVRLDDNWFFNADVRRIWINSKVTIYAGLTRINADVDINPWVTSFSFGYRF